MLRELLVRERTTRICSARTFIGYGHRRPTLSAPPTDEVIAHMPGGVGCRPTSENTVIYHTRCLHLHYGSLPHHLVDQVSA
jgi:hypothetical protein